MTEFARKKQVSDDIRNRIVTKYEAGKSLKVISSELEMNQKTVSTIIRLYKITGRINAKKNRLPLQKKINENISIFIKELLAEDCSITLSTIREKILAAKGVSVSKSSIARSISDFNFSFKRVTFIPMARNLSNNVNSRFIYANNYLSLDENKIMFLDEFGVSCSLRVRNGRSLRGTSPRKNVRVLRSKNYSVSAAITKQGLFHYKILNKAFDGENYTHFITNILTQMNEKNMFGYTLILDNCTIHKVSRVQNLFLDLNNTLLFLPPYSPHLNAIEEFFSKWKTNIKTSNCDTVDELQNAINTGHLNINANDCAGYFRDVRKYALKAMRMEDF